MIWRLAFRNLFRNKRRTIITLCSIAFGVWVATIIVGVRDFTYNKAINLAAYMGTGHVTFQAKAYNDNPTLEKRISGMSRFYNFLKSEPLVEAAMPRISAQAMVASAIKTSGVQIIGMDPDLETEKHNLYLRSMHQGKPFNHETSRGCIIGSILAQQLNVGIGNKVVFTTADVNGEIISELAYVTGIFKTGSDEIDAHLMIMPLADLQKALRFKPHETNIIAVYLKDQTQSKSFRASFAKKFNSDVVEVLDWRETRPELANYISLDLVIHRVFVLFVGVVVAIGILNTMFMNIFERKKELGIMLAVGLGPFKLFLVLMVEAILLGFGGLVVGSISIIPVYLFMYFKGLDFSAFVGDKISAAGVVIDFILKTDLRLQSAIAIGLGLLILSACAALYPAIKASKTPALDNIRSLS